MPVYTSKKYGYSFRYKSGGGSTDTAGRPAYSSTRTSLAPASIEEMEEIAYSIETGTGGITTIDFWDDNLLASQTAHQIHTGSGFTLSYIMPYRGSIIATAVSGSANKTAGTASFDFFINGVNSGASCLLPDSTKYAYARFNKGQYGWSTGSYVDIRVTTDGSYAPATLDFEVVCYLALDQSEVQ